MSGAIDLTAQPRLAVKTTGTNELEFTLSPIVPNGYYEVMARSNSPDAHWIGLTGVIGGSNQSVSITYKPDGQHFRIADLAHWTLIATVGCDSDGDGLPDNYEELISHTDPWWGDTGNVGVEDGYKDPDGDNWVNLQELSNGTDPFEWNQPPLPAAISSCLSSGRTHGDGLAGACRAALSAGARASGAATSRPRTCASG